MKSKIILMMFFSITIFLNSVFPQSDSLQIGDAEKFLELGGNLHGLAFDDAGFMYVCKNGKSIYKIAPDGTDSLFCTIDSTGHWEDTHSTYVWNFELGEDNHFYAAARNRILKISLDGEVTTLIKEQFTTTWGGVTGIELDNEGNIYVAYKNKIAMYSPSLEKTVLIESDSYEFISLEFDRDFKYLYSSGGKLEPWESKGKVYSFEVNPDGTLNDPVILFESSDGRPEYIIIDKMNNIYSSIYAGNRNQNNIVQISNDSSIAEFNIESITNNETMEFGREGFDEHSIYLTTWLGSIFKVYIGTEGVTVSVDDDHSYNEQIPTDTRLFQNYPNPFNPLTNIKYGLPSSSIVRISIYDALGKLVDVIKDEYVVSGEHTIEFDGSNLSSGVYYYQLTTDYSSNTKKFALVK